MIFCGKLHFKNLPDVLFKHIRIVRKPEAFFQMSEGRLH